MRFIKSFFSQRTVVSFLVCSMTILTSPQLLAGTNNLVDTLLLAQADTASAESGASTEEVVVVGIRKSLEDARDAKRNADQVLDSIQSEDIGKLPDFNVSEAMQRITGVQIDRDLIGDGESFQVRGLSQNRVEINGRTLISSGQDFNDTRGNVLNTTSSALFKSIEVIKTPTADMIEGSLGATVNLKTFKPLDFKSDHTLNLSAQLSDQELAEDTGYNVKALYATKFETGLGNMGFLVNLDVSEKHTTVDQLVNLRLRPIANNQATFPEVTGFSAFRPNRGNLNRRDINSENQGIDVGFEWEINDSLSVFAQATVTNNERIRDQAKYSWFPQVGNYRFSEAPTVQEFSWVSSSDPVSDPNFLYLNTGSKNNPVWVEAPAEQVRRGIITSGRYRPGNNTKAQGTNKVVEVTSGREFLDEDQEAFSLGVEWLVTDALFGKVEYARSESNYFRNNLFTTYRPRAFVPNSKNPGVDPDVELQPAFIWDFDVPTDFPTYRLDFTDVDARIAADGSANPVPGPVDMYNTGFYSFHNIGGRFDNKHALEDALSADFDWDINLAGITTFEFGLRMARQQRDRDRTRYGNFDPNDPDSVVSGSVNWETMSIFSMEYLNGDSNPTNDVTRDQTFLPELVSAGAIPANFFNMPASDFMFEGFSGDIRRRFPETTIFDINYYLNLAQTYFPGRIETTDPGPDGIPGNADDVILTTGISAFGIGNWVDYAFDLEELTTAAYFKANFEYDLGGFPLTGNAGVRLVNTDFEGTAYDSGLQQFVTDDQDYDNVLPSVNLTLGLMDDMHVRLGLSKALSRPNPVDLVPSRDLDNDLDGARVGNPNLKPMEAEQVDLSWEWYHNESSLLSVAYFYKELENIFVNNTSLDPNHDSDDDGDIDADDDPFETRTTINKPGGKLKGAEIAYQTVFDFLPSPFDGFGLVANYTYSDSESAPTGNLNQVDGLILPLPNQSENSYNLILFWEKWGVSTRLAYNYRDYRLQGDSMNRTSVQPLGIVDPLETEAQRSLDPNAPDVIVPLLAELPQYIDDSEQLDFEVSYTWNSWRFFANARDLTQEPRRQTSGLPNSIYLRGMDYTGTTYRVGVRYKLTF